jgi:hypothetical protein
LATANADLATATGVRTLHAEGVEAIRGQVVAAVRESRAAPIREQLEAVRARYEQEVQLLLEVFPIADALARHRSREAELVAQLGEALRERSPSVSIPEVQIELVVTRDRAREVVESVPHLSDKLRRMIG